MVWEALWPFTKHSLVCKELFHLQPHLTTSAVWAHTPTQQPPFPGCHGDHPRQWTGKSVPVRVGGWDSGDHQPAFSRVQKGLEPSRESLQASCLCPPRLWSLPLAGPVTESREWPLVGAENSGSRSRGSPAHPYSMPKHPLHPNLMLGVLSPLCPSHAVRDLPEAPPHFPAWPSPVDWSAVPHVEGTVWPAPRGAAPLISPRTCGVRTSQLSHKATCSC